MADLITDVAKYLKSLPITHPICVQTAATISLGKNLFFGVEPKLAPANATCCITFYPSIGFGMSKANDTSMPALQVRVRTKSWKRGYDTTNAIICDFHKNSTMLASTNGICFSYQSQGNYLGPEEDMNHYAYSANFYFQMVRYDKITK
jgi:hypothetical protein